MLDFTEPASSAISSTSLVSRKRETRSARAAGLPARARAAFLEPARERPDLALRRQQLSQGPAARPRSTCFTGTATARTCRVRCSPTTCATPTWKQAARPGCHSRCAAKPVDLGSAWTCRPSSSPRAKITSCRGDGYERATTRRPHEFVLGASGHIAGVINPASKNRRNYWLGGELALRTRQSLGLKRTMARSRDRASWKLVDPIGRNGSRSTSGPQASPARAPGPREAYKPIEPAPGCTCGSSA